MKEQALKILIKNWRKKKGQRFYLKLNKKAQILAHSLAEEIAVKMFMDLVKELEGSYKRLGLTKDKYL